MLKNEFSNPANYIMFEEIYFYKNTYDCWTAMTDIQIR